MILRENPATGFMTDAHDEDGTFIATMINVHNPNACAGRGCAIHNHPSDHPLKDAPMIWKNARGILERLCQHGVGHPDYDSALYLTSIGAEAQNIHACDGCC